MAWLRQVLRSERGVLFLGSTVVLCAGGWLIVAFHGSWGPLLSPASAVDSGARTLIVISADGGERDYETVVNAEVDDHGERFTMLVRSPGLESGPSSRIDFQITAAGPHSGMLECPSLMRKPGAYEDLPTGVQTALDVDASGGFGSAINYAGGRASKLEGTKYTTYAGMLGIDSESAWRTGDFFDSGWQWSVQCSLPRAAVWRVDSDSPESSLLIPQVNLVGTDGAVDHQTALSMWTSIDRQSGVELVQSYPPAESYDSYWRYRSLDNHMTLENGTLRYTDQPTLLFAPRDLETRQAQAWGVAGLILGVGGSLVVSWVTALVKLVHALIVARRRAI